MTYRYYSYRHNHDDLYQKYKSTHDIVDLLD